MVDFGFAVPSILIRKFSPSRFLLHILYLIRFDPPPSTPLQANCLSSPLNSSANRLPKDLLEVSEVAG